jgi:hypothetical protein
MAGLLYSPPQRGLMKRKTGAKKRCVGAGAAINQDGAVASN